MKHICAHASPGPGAEEGANACPGEAAGKCENAGAGATLKRGSTAGSDADGLASEKECIAVLRLELLPYGLPDRPRVR